MSRYVLHKIPGQGSIEVRDESPFLYLRYRIMGEPFNPATTISKHWTSEREKQEAIAAASLLLAEKIGEGMKGEHPTRVGLALTVHQAIEEYRTSLKTGKGLSRPMACHLNRIDADLGKSKVVQLTANQLTLWVQRLKKTGKKTSEGLTGYSNDTIHTMTSILATALRYAQDTHKLPALPRMPEVGKLNIRRKFTTAEDFARVLPLIDSPVVRDIQEFLFSYGWRRSEPLSLTWPQIDLEHGVITLYDSKNEEGRAVPMTPSVRAIFERRLADRKPGCALVFHENGFPINRDRITRSLKAAYKAAGMEGITPHDFRRTAARDLVIGAHVPAIIAKEITGHKTLQMFDRYVIKDITGTTAAMNALDAFRGQSVDTGQVIAIPAEINQTVTDDTPLTNYTIDTLILGRKFLLDMACDRNWHLRVS